MAENEAFVQAAKVAREMLLPKQAARQKLMDQVAALDDEIARLQIVAGLDKITAEPKRVRNYPTTRKPPAKQEMTPEKIAAAEAKFTNAWGTISTTLKGHIAGVRQSELEAQLKRNGTMLAEGELDQNLQAARKVGKAKLEGRKWFHLEPIPPYMLKT